MIYTNEANFKLSQKKFLDEQGSVYRIEVFKQIKKINKISMLVLTLDLDKNLRKKHFITLMTMLNNFVIRSKIDLTHNQLTKLQLVKLIEQLKDVSLDLVENQLTIDTFSKYCFEHFVVHHNKEILKHYLDYEVCCYLHLESILSAQNKFQVKKIKNIELYSELINAYKKSIIFSNIIELYFQKHREELLKKIVNQDYKINQIHFDENYLQYYIINSNIYKLCDKNFQHQFEHLLVKVVYNSNI